MPYVQTPTWVDDQIGPDAYSSISMFNQQLWDNNTAFAESAICEALELGGLGRGQISQKSGRYEGQIMAIRRGFVDGRSFDAARYPNSVDWYEINDAGRAFLHGHGKPDPVILHASDCWHSGMEFDFTAFEITQYDKPMIQLFEKVRTRVSAGMHPALDKKQVVELRDYLNDWLARHP